jgi:hypothetical protein
MKFVILIAALALIGGFFAIREWRAFDYNVALELPGPQYRCVRDDGINFPAGGWTGFDDVRAVLAWCDEEAARKHDSGGDPRF